MRSRNEREGERFKEIERVKERATGSETDRKRGGSIVARQMQCLIDRDCLCSVQ